MVSYDGGETWGSGGLGYLCILSLAFDKNQNLIAGTYGGGIYSSTQAVTSVGGGNKDLPSDMRLSQNYPNPFNPQTQIEYDISTSSNVVLKVYDILGRDVALLVNERKGPGHYTLSWNASGLPSGIYFCRMQAGRYIETRKMLLMR
jgi:hypothetical protein